MSFFESRAYKTLEALSDHKESAEIEKALSKMFSEHLGLKLDEPICAECMKNCEEMEADAGEGFNEGYGQSIHHERIVTVSSCCQGDLI